MRSEEVLLVVDDWVVSDKKPPFTYGREYMGLEMVSQDQKGVPDPPSRHHMLLCLRSLLPAAHERGVGRMVIEETISLPCALSAGTTQLTLGSPSMRVRQQPHWPCGWQPSLVDRMPQRFRRVSSRLSPSRTATVCGAPFSVKSMVSTG